MKTLKNRLDTHFVAVAAVAGAAAVAGTAQKSEAAIVWSGIVNLPVATSINGLYLNIVTGAINEPGNTSGASVPGWDINPYGSTQTWYGFGNPGWNYVGSGGVLTQMAFGGLIDAGTATGTGSASSAAFPTASPGAYVGFRFQNEAAANQIQNAWARYYRPAGAPGVLVEYAYEDTGGSITAGAVPAPGSIALLALGALGLAGRRRK